MLNQLLADIDFARQSGEFTREAPLLRYVAALNHDATRQQFIEACAAAGYNRGSAGNRFHESRTFDRDSYGLIWNPDGSMVEPS